MYSSGQSWQVLYKGETLIAYGSLPDILLALHLFEKLHFHGFRVHAS